MRALVAPLVAAGDEDTAELLVQDILRASSRTASGGDAYAAAASLLVRPGNLLTPAAVEVGCSCGWCGWVGLWVVCGQYIDSFFKYTADIVLTPHTIKNPTVRAPQYHPRGRRGSVDPRRERLRAAPQYGPNRRRRRRDGC